MSDVCLFVEGTYPYVSGGVASWTHELVSRLSNLTFSIVYIGSRSDEPLFAKYKLPSNVNGIYDYFLFDEFHEGGGQSSFPDKELRPKAYDAFVNLHSILHSQTGDGVYAKMISMKSDDIKKFIRSIEVLFPMDQISRPLFKSLSSRGVWKVILNEYEKLGFQIPFIDFFYTWRAAHIPIFRILSARYPKARVYHSLCTGYAGLAASQASISHRVPLILTEHGIYSHERAVEISDANWLTQPSEKISTDDASDQFKRWWIDLFRNMSRITYALSSEIITLYEGNRQRELFDGADSAKTKIIVNGISGKFSRLRVSREKWKHTDYGKKNFTVGFFGRVVSIKDIKTLIKSMRVLKDNAVNVKCFIVGPTTDEIKYVSECQELVRFLELQDIIEFKNEMKATEFYPMIDCLVLTSISEAQPLVVLEANAAGVPVVSTHVGSCPELLQGRNEEDRLLGPSGIITPIGDPDFFADSLIRIMSEPGLWEKMSEAGMKRVSAYYNETAIWSQYRLIYREYLSGLQSGVSSKVGGSKWLE